MNHTHKPQTKKPNKPNHDGIMVESEDNMTKVNANTKKGMAIIRDYEYAQKRGLDTIYKAYEKPSYEKVSSFDDIKTRALATNGYNHDLVVCGHGTWTYSTVYSYTVDGVRYIVKDTKENTFVVEVRDYE